MHRCPAARVTGTGCNWTPITYVHAAGEIGKGKNEKNEIKANEPQTGEAKCAEEVERREPARIGRQKFI